MLREPGFALICGIVFAGCSSSALPPNPSMGGEPGPISKLYDGLEPEEAWVPCDIDSKEPAGITAIAIEETPCYGFCPTYTMVLRADGSVSYTGQANVEFIGERTGLLDPDVFQELARLAIDLGFFNLEDFYACAITDHSTTYLSIVRNGERKTIKHYAPELSGPPRLRWFKAWISIAADSIEWD